MRPLHAGFFFLLLLAVVGCDHTTKHLAFAELAGGPPISLVPDVLSLQYVTNTDTAFGMLESVLDAPTRWSVILGVQGLVTLGIALWLARRFRQATWLERSAGALVLGGAIGNFTDRLFRGHVIDFIHVSYWPVFNVADIAVCLGTGLFAIVAKRDLFPGEAREPT